MTGGTCSSSSKRVGWARGDAFTARGKLTAVASETEVGRSKTCTALRGASGASQVVLRREKGRRWATFDTRAIGQNEAGKAALTLQLIDGRCYVETGNPARSALRRATVTLMFVVISDHARAGTDTITICRNTASAEGELAIPTYDAIVRRRPGARSTGWRTSLTGCTVAETPVRAHGSRVRHRLHGIALGTVISILGEALFASDAYATPVRALLATQLAYCAVAVPIKEESGCARSTLSTIGCGGPASVARTLPIGAANPIETVACRRGIGAGRGETAARSGNTVVAGSAPCRTGLA